MYETFILILWSLVLLAYMCIVFVYCQVKTVTCHLPLQGLVHYSPSTAKGVQGKDQEGGTLGSGKSWQNRQAFRCCCCSVPQLCPTLCYPMECSMPVFHVFHHPSSELTQTQVQWVNDAIQLTVLPLSSFLQSFPSLRLFASGGQSIEMGSWVLFVESKTEFHKHGNMHTDEIYYRG